MNSVKHRITRSSGVLMPIFSLPSPHGIGTLGKAAYEFVDFLKKTGQTYWQILPLGPTGPGASPYQTYSTAAGNTNFIDLDFLVESGLLSKESLSIADLKLSSMPTKIDYELLESVLKERVVEASQNAPQEILDMAADFE